MPYTPPDSAAMVSLVCSMAISNYIVCNLFKLVLYTLPGASTSSFIPLKWARMISLVSLEMVLSDSIKVIHSWLFNRLKIIPGSSLILFLNWSNLISIHFFTNSTCCCNWCRSCVKPDMSFSNWFLDIFKPAISCVNWLLANMIPCYPVIVITMLYLVLTGSYMLLNQCSLVSTGC